MESFGKDFKVSDLQEPAIDIVKVDLQEIKKDLIVALEIMDGSDLEDLEFAAIFDLQRKITDAHWLINESARESTIYAKSVRENVRDIRNKHKWKH